MCQCSSQLERDSPFVEGLEGLKFFLSNGNSIANRKSSGKTSLLMALVRLLELDSGSICIDGINVANIPVDILRPKISVLPQQVYFLPGSIRRNLDPTATISDDRLIAALIKVGLWSRLGESLDKSLDTASLSHGQRQLLCIARILITKPKILVLDEATSSLDEGNDKIIQRLVREELGDCTVVAIAHRLHSVVDFDTVAIMEKGLMVEIGSPSELLSDPTTHFARLYQDTT
jgi:ATP-binding cassette subfamily C (CFTR/MRP) protein 1